MFRFIKVAVLMLVVFVTSTASFAQGAQRSSTVIGNVESYARVLSNAQITVCTYNPSTPLVCGTPITVYQDPAMTIPYASTTFRADANGNYSYWTVAGNYTEQICATGTPCRTQVVTLSSGSGTGGGGVDPGTAHRIGQYDPGGTNIQQSNVTTDSTGNNINVPGTTTSTAVTAFQVNQHFYTAGATVGSALTCPNGGTTSLECAINAAKAYASANSLTAIVHTAPNGPNAICNAETFSGAQRVRIVGDGKQTSLIQASCSIAGYMVTYACMSGTSDADPVGVTDVTFDGNKLAGGGLAFFAQNESQLEHLIFRNFTSSTLAPLQIGSTSCSAGTTGSTFQNTLYDIYVDAKGTGPTSWAQVAMTVTAGSPSVVNIASGGLYNYPNPPAVIHGFGAGANPCTVMGTATAVTAPVGSQYTVTGISGLNTFSGCAVGKGIYAYVPDVSPAPYGIDMEFATDLTGTQLKTNGFKVGIHNTNTGNSFYGSHPYNGIVGIQDDAGANWYGTDCDSNLIMFDIKLPGLFSGCTAFYNNTNSPGAMMFLLENGQNGSTFFGNKAVTASLPSDYHQFVAAAGGPVDTGQGSWPSNTVDFGSPTAEANALNARHVTGFQSVDDYVGPQTQATSSTNFNSFNRFWCPSVWNGSRPQYNCWGIQANPSTSGIPTQEGLNVIAPSNHLAPVSGLFFLLNAPGSATVGSNINSMTFGIRGSYNDGTAAHSAGWNFITQFGTGTGPFNTLFISPTFCVGGCEIQTSGNIHLTGSAFFQGAKYEIFNGSFTADFISTTLTGNRVYTYPDKSGTVAMTSDIPAAAVIRAGSATVSASTTQVVTFTPAMSATPDACVLTPQSDPTTVGAYWVTSLSTTGFTINVHTSGTISFLYSCVKNNTN